MTWSADSGVSGSTPEKAEATTWILSCAEAYFARNISSRVVFAEK